MQSIHQGQQLAAVGRGSRALSAIEAALDFGHGSVMVSGHRPVVEAGVACRDTATGSGYLLYSAESVHTRFSAHPPHPGNADHFICVVYSGGWQYDNNGGLYALTPTGTDVLVAEVDLTADTVTDLEGQSGMLHGIAYGYVAGNLVFEANKWDGIYNPGEFTVTGTSFTVSGTIVNTSCMRCPHCPIESWLALGLTR